MHRPMNNKTMLALEKLVEQNHVLDQLFHLGLDPEHFSVHTLHNRKPLIDLSYVIRIKDKKLETAFQKTQEDIWSTIGEEHYFTLPGEFHITVYTHVYADSEYQNVEITLDSYAARQALFCQWATRQTAAVLQPQPAWGILYTNVIITPDAVIVVAEDTGIMQRLRHGLVQYGNQHHFYEQRDEKTIFPNIIHTTLARFLRPVSLEQRLSMYEKIQPRLPLLLPMQVAEIEFRQFYHYGIFPKDNPIFTVKLLSKE
jgi:hypothetical protein